MSAEGVIRCLNGRGLGRARPVRRALSHRHHYSTMHPRRQTAMLCRAPSRAVGQAADGPEAAPRFGSHAALVYTGASIIMRMRHVKSELFGHRADARLGAEYGSERRLWRGRMCQLCSLRLRPYSKARDCLKPRLTTPESRLGSAAIDRLRLYRLTVKEQIGCTGGSLRLARCGDRARWALSEHLPSAR